MVAYVLRRVVALVPILVGITVVVFLIMRVVPGDVATVIGGDSATQADLDKIRQQLKLNDPVYLQYGRFLVGVVHGDLGRSAVSRQPVLDEVLARAPATLELALASTLVTIVVGVVAGVISAVRRNSLIDDAATTVALFGISMPPYWLGMVLVLFFSLKLHWFPTSGRGGISHLILPALTLGLYSAGLVTRMTRSNLIEVLGEDFLRTARAKGLSEWRVVMGHALRNAMIPTVAIIGLQFGNMLGRSVIIESVFAWPGLGQLMLKAISTRDIPTLQGTVLVIAMAFVLINLIVDLIYGFLDPRIRYR